VDGLSPVSENELLVGVDIGKVVPKVTAKLADVPLYTL
jgi:hypothetical protein